MKKIAALIFAVGLFMSSAIYASADTTHTSTLSIYHGQSHTGQPRKYDAGHASLTMDVDTIHQYYGGENYCKLYMEYKKKNLLSTENISSYTKIWYTGVGGYYQSGMQSSGTYYYRFRADRNGLSSDSVTMKHFT